MEGILKENNDISINGPSIVHDACLIAAEQKI
jgi:hypothetical protein